GSKPSARPTPPWLAWRWTAAWIAVRGWWPAVSRWKTRARPSVKPAARSGCIPAERPAPAASGLRRGQFDAGAPWVCQHCPVRGARQRKSQPAPEVSAPGQQEGHVEQTRVARVARLQAGIASELEQRRGG